MPPNLKLAHQAASIKREVRINVYAIQVKEVSAKTESTSSFCFMRSLPVVSDGPALALVGGGRALCQSKPRMCTCFVWSCFLATPCSPA